MQQQIQTAPVESAPVRAAHSPTEELSLEEMLRIMDVASTLRKEQTLVEQQLNLEETKAMLRTRLLEAAEVTGEKLTLEQVDIAIDSYFDKLHQFEEPTGSFEVFLAHLYVMRGTLLGWAVGIAATAGILSWLF